MFKEYLKNYRKKHNLSQTEMAKRLNTNQGSYSLIETGKRKPSFVFIRKLANVCEVTPEFIVSLS